jgi:hypothetical protein
MWVGTTVTGRGRLHCGKASAWIVRLNRVLKFGLAVDEEIFVCYDSACKYYNTNLRRPDAYPWAPQYAN